MKRDMSLIRQILFKVEEQDERNLPSGPFAIDGFDDHIVGKHVQLLDEAGLIKAKVLELDSGDVRTVVFRLTWEGHEFLDAARDDSVWKKTIGRMKSEGLSIGFEVLKVYLVSQMKQQLKLPS